MSEESTHAKTESEPRKAPPRKRAKRHYDRSTAVVTSNAKLWTVLAATLVLTLSIALLAWGALLSIGNLKLLSNGTRVRGIVTRVEYVQSQVERRYKDASGTERTARENASVPVSTITFRAEDEKQYSFTPASIADGGAIENRVGYKVGVIYDTENPQGARIDNGWAQWQPSLVMFGFGLALLIMGTVLARLVTRTLSSGRIKALNTRAARVGMLLDTFMVVAWNVIALWAMYLWLTQSRLSETMHYALCILPAVLMGILLTAGSVKTIRPLVSK